VEKSAPFFIDFSSWWVYGGLGGLLMKLKDVGNKVRNKVWNQVGDKVREKVRDMIK
jgi:hypothetical protein